MDFDNGCNLVAEIKNCNNVIPKDSLSNLLKITQNFAYNESEIALSVNDIGKEPGMNFYDIFVMQCFISQLAFKLQRKIKVVELGCGTSTRMFSNNENVDMLTTYALEDANINNDNIKYVQCNVLDNKKVILDACKNADLLFVDCDHSYNFAKFYCENILSYIDIPVIMHDFLPVVKNKYFPSTWGEQYYILHEFLPKEIYKLYAYTALSDDEVNLLADKNLMAARTKRIFPCIAIFLNFNSELLLP